MRLDPDTLSAIAALPGDWHDSGNLGEGVIRRMAALVAEHRPGGPALSAETGCGKSTLLFSHLSGEHLCFTLEGGDSYARPPPARCWTGTGSASSWAPPSARCSATSGPPRSTSR
jgi:hypothetical protein